MQLSAASKAPGHWSQFSVTIDREGVTPGAVSWPGHQDTHPMAITAIVRLRPGPLLPCSPAPPVWNGSRDKVTAPSAGAAITEPSLRRGGFCSFILLQIFPLPVFAKDFWITWANKKFKLLFKLPIVHWMWEQSLGDQSKPLSPFLRDSDFLRPSVKVTQWRKMLTFSSPVPSALSRDDDQAQVGRDVKGNFQKGSV